MTSIKLPNCLSLCFPILTIFTLSMMCTCQHPLTLTAFLLPLKWSYLLENQTRHLILPSQNTILVMMVTQGPKPVASHPIKYDVFDVSCFIT